MTVRTRARWASVIGLFLNVAALLLTAYSVVTGPGAPSVRTRNDPADTVGDGPTDVEADEMVEPGRVPAATETDGPPPPRGRRRVVLVAVAAGVLLLALAGGAVALVTRHGSGRPAGSVASGRADTGTASPAASASRVPPRTGPVGSPYLVRGSEVGFDGTSGHGCRAWMNGSDPGPYVQGVITSSGDDCEMAVWRSRNGGNTFAVLSGVHRIRTGTESTQYYWAGDTYLARVCLTNHVTGQSGCGGAFGGAGPTAGSRPPGPGT